VRTFVLNGWCRFLPDEDWLTNQWKTRNFLNEKIGVDKEYAEALIEQIIFVDKAKKRIAMDRDKLAEERMVVMGKLIRYESDSAAARFEYLQKELRVEDRAARERLQNDVIVKLDEISRKQDKICF